MTSPGSGDGAPPPTWSSYLLTLPRELRDLALYRFLDGAVRNRQQYGHLLLEIARSMAGVVGATPVTGGLVAKALAVGADLQEWTRYLLQLPQDQQELILYTYLEAIVHDRDRYLRLLRQITRQVFQEQIQLIADDLLRSIVAQSEHAS
jgi:hypothetical protein